MNDFPVETVTGDFTHFHPMRLSQNAPGVRSAAPGVWTQGRYVATRHRVRQTAGDYRTELLRCGQVVASGMSWLR